ncbi:hypothetical protein MKX03_029626 [Papaver bracteatum]|nr:hypothetical protein MKX03_029626 [Papaver bracteatum]
MARQSLHPYNSSRNHGFAFVKYYNNTCDEYSGEKVLRPKFKQDKNAPIANWADPKHSDTSEGSAAEEGVQNTPH